MKVLYFTNADVGKSSIEEVIRARSSVIRMTEKLNLDLVQSYSFDFLVSDRASFIVPKPVLDYFEGRAINCHTSFLPHNRGGLNILWATVLQSPYGVTIHKMVERFDEGGIVCQSSLALSKEYSLRKAYEIVRSNMESLFEVAWNSGLIFDTLRSDLNLIPNHVFMGSSQSVKQCEKAKELLPNGWETKLQYIFDRREDFLRIL